MRWLRAVCTKQCCSFSQFANGRCRCLNYNQIRSNQSAGVGSFREFQPAGILSEKNTVTSPFACRSSTNRCIRSVVYRRRHGRRHGGGPWISNEKFDFRARQSSTARRSLINSLLQDTCDGKNIYFLFYFWIYAVDEMR